MSGRQRVVCFGDCGIDRYLATGAEDKLRPGGCSLNLAVNLVRLAAKDLEVEMVTAVGDDSGGTVVSDVLTREGIRAHVARLKGRTPEQRIGVDSDGEKHFVGYDAGVLSDWRLSAAQQASVANGDWLVSVVYTQFEAALRAALQPPRNGRLALDFMTLRDYGGKVDAVADLLALADVAFFGLTPTEVLCMEELRARTREQPLLAIVTLGAAGGVAFADGEPLRFQAIPVSQVVDTTGAGDAFAAAFLSRHVRGASLRTSLDFAAAHAAKVVARMGAF